MEKELLIGVFSTEDDIVAATRSARAAGYAIHDVFTPYAVHGLDEAMGLKGSRLPWVCTAFAVSGLTIALLLQYWTSAVDWPLNVGGKPLNSLPAYLPVMFEAMVLAGGVGVVLTLLARARLYPGKVESLLGVVATDNRFVLAIDTTGRSCEAKAVFQLWEEYRVIEVQSFCLGEK